MHTDQLGNIITKKLKDNYEQLSKQYFNSNVNTSTKFFILDDLLPVDVVLNIYKNFPNKETYNYRSTFRERKLTFANLHSLENSIIDNASNAFQMNSVIKIIERITKIQDLEGDHSQYAGGISRMDSGHFLNPHIDNSHNSNRTKYRRLNLLYYVTPEIIESDGGNLELWDEKILKCVKIPAKFNRLVVMETTKDSWHSVDRICSNIERCCSANYFFSEKSPENYEYYHVTSFLGRPNERLQRSYGALDNLFRNTFSRISGISRGKKLMRKPIKD